MLAKDPNNRPTISQVIHSTNEHSFSERKDTFKSRKAYQKEISIKIPTPTNIKSKNPSSAPNNILESPYTDKATMPGALTNRSNTYFNFSESLLKQCPSSPIRPMLMGDFLKRRLGDEVFERIRRVINNSINPVKLLHEEPWIFSDICGEHNLSIIDAAIACGAFNMKDKPIFPNSSTNKVSRTRAFPMLSRKASQ